MTTKDIMRHLANGGQVFRITPRERFFYKIDDGKLMCRVNELGGWHLSARQLRDTDKLHVATKDWKIEGWGRDQRVVEIDLIAKLENVEEV